MIIRKKIFGFQSIGYILEPWPDVAKLKKQYRSIGILSHESRPLKGFQLKKKKTPVIDLRGDLDDIFKKFNETSRNEIRRSERTKGLTFKVDDPNFSQAHKIYCDHEYAQGRVPSRPEEFKGCKIFGAYYHNEMISVIICFDSPRYLRAKSISSKRMEVFDRELYKIIGYASRRLVWEICQYGQKNHYQGFDLGAINLTDPAKEGIAKFKQSFGAKCFRHTLLAVLII